MRIKLTIINLLVTFLCLLISYLIHMNSFIDLDVDWHVEGAKRLLSGGNYLLNVFDDNSPFVFAFYFPVVWLHQLTQISYPPLIILYVLFCNAVSLMLVHSIVDQGNQAGDLSTKLFIYYALVFCLIFLPEYNFGQREMILINFLMPYFLILIFTGRDPRIKIDKIVFATSAVMASFAVMQNPIYLSVLIVIDIIRYTKSRLFDAQQLLFYGLVVLEVGIVQFSYPEYVKVILPLVFCYEGGFNSDPVELFLYSYLVVLSLLLAFIQIKRSYQNTDIVMTFAAVLVSLSIYYFERKMWYNHLYPAVVFSVLLLVLLLIKSSKTFFLDKKSILNVTTLSICIGVALISTLIREVVLFGVYEVRDFHDPTSPRKRWVNYIDQHFKDKKVFYMIVNELQSHILPMYVNTITVSPWFNPWFVPYILKTQNSKMGYFCNPEQDARLFVYLIAKTIKNTQPDFVVINIPNATVKLQGFNQIFTLKNITLLLHGYYIYDHFLNNIIYKKGTGGVE